MSTLAVPRPAAPVEARSRLVARNDGHDLPVALVEDAVAVLGGFAIAALTAIV